MCHPTLNKPAWCLSVCRCRVLVCLCVFTQTSLSEITKVPVARAAFNGAASSTHLLLSITHVLFSALKTHKTRIEIQHSVLHTRRCMYTEHTHSRVCAPPFHRGGVRQKKRESEKKQFNLVRDFRTRNRSQQAYIHTHTLNDISHAPMRAGGKN